MSTLQKIGLALVALAISFGLGYFATPTKVKTETITKTETLKVEGKTKVVYREKVTQKDGTIIEKEYEKEQSNSEERTKALTEYRKEIEKDTGLVIGALGYVNTKELTNGIDYGVIASKRVLGAINVIGSVVVEKDSNVKLGAGVGWSF